MAASARPLIAGERTNVRQFLVYVGTYTGPKSKGIYVCRFDVATGKLSAPELAAEAVNPSFIAIHPNRRFIYAVCEMRSAGDKKCGAVSAFLIAQDTGRLTLLNQVSSGGAGPCHLTVENTGKCVLVANYRSGSVAAVSIQADGRLAEATAVVQHAGSSVDPARQKGPHAHSVNLDAANRFAFVADLGLDEVRIYRFDPNKGTLAPNNPPSASVKPGSGPRHFAFHPSGRFAYVINEMGNTVTVFSYDPAGGALIELQTIPTIPDNYRGETYTSEVRIHPSGKYLYGSNRGHDSIAVFAIDQDKGILTTVAIQPCGGKCPRHFAIDPAGGWLLVGNECSDTIALFSIDPNTGKLTMTGDVVPVPAPVCIKFLPIQ